VRLGGGGLRLRLAGGLSLGLGADTESLLETGFNVLSLFQELLEASLVELLLGLVLLDLVRDELHLGGLEGGFFLIELGSDLVVFGLGSTFAEVEGLATVGIVLDADLSMGSSGLGDRD